MRRQNLAATTALALLAAVATAPAASASVPVFDSGSIAQASTIAANTGAQVNQLTTIVTTTQNLVSAVGSAGASAGALSAPGWQDMQNGGDLLNKLRTYPANLCQVAGCPKNMPESEAQRLVSGEIPTLAAGVAFANRTFYSAGQVSGDAPEPFSDSNGDGSYTQGERFTDINGNGQWDSSTGSARGLFKNDLRSYAIARDNAVRQSAISGYALALLSRDHLASSAQRATSLETMVNDATTLREDVQANSAVLIAMQQQLAHLQALNASQLEVEAARAIRQDGSIIAAQGGTRPPATYMPDDFSSTGIRTGVTNPGVMTGGAAGVSPSARSGGGGGGFLEAVTGLGGGSGGLVADIAGTLSRSGEMQGSTEVAALFALGRDIAAQTGHPEVARVLSTASGAASGRQNPQDVLWATADAAASVSGNYQMRQIVGLGRTAVEAGNQQSAESVMRATSQMARTMGRPDLAQYVNTMKSSWRNGEIDQNAAVTNVVHAASQVSGNQELNGLFTAGAQQMTNERVQAGDPEAVRRANVAISAEGLRAIGQRTDNPELTNVAGSASEVIGLMSKRAAETAREDNGSDANPQSSQSGGNTPAFDHGAVQPWDNPDTPTNETARNPGPSSAGSEDLPWKQN